MTSNLALLRAANDNVPRDNDGRYILPLEGGWQSASHPYRVPRHRMETPFTAATTQRCNSQFAALPGEAPGVTLIVRTGREPTESERINGGKPTPLQRAFEEGRIPPRLSLYAEKVEKAYRIATSPHNGGTRAPKDLAPGALTGGEITANAAGICRLLKYRCGPLWGPLVAACVHGMPLAEIGRKYFTESKLDKGEASKVGTAKVTDALRFAKTAIDDLVRWEDLERHIDPPIARLRRAIGSDEFPASWHDAANDDVRRIASVAA